MLTIETLSLGTVFELGYYVLLFVFVVHALMLGYHWFEFGQSRRTSTIALAVYLSGGALLFLTLAGLLYTF
jgi:hypothetical protein